MLDFLRDMRSMQDIRLAKARLRYESLLAEKQLTDNLSSLERGFTFITNMRRTANTARKAYQVVSGIASFFQRLFTRTPKEGPQKEEEGKVVY